MSEQITVVEPSVSTAESFLRMARFCAMRHMPMDSVTVTTAGRPSGIAATASATAVIAASVQGRPRAKSSEKMTVTTTPAIAASFFPSVSSCFCSGVSDSTVLAIMPASLPISVAMPVAVTTISARPRVTTVFI